MRWGRRESNDDLILLRITSPDPDPAGIDYFSCRIGDIVDAYKATINQLRSLKAISQGNSDWAMQNYETRLEELTYSGDVKKFNKYHGNPFPFFSI